MSESSLVVVEHSQAIQQGGVGIDFGSKLFQLKPATLTINQPNTQTEGAIKGKLRISETGDQFEEMYVTLLKMPVEQRAYYIGEPGQLNRTPDNLMCFSRDMFRPDAAAKVPQSIKCDGCPKASWEKWRQSKKKEDIPPCDAYYYALFIDTVYKMPMQMYIRSKSKGPFEAGMQNLARTFAKMKSQGQNPNIWDIKFRLSTEAIKTGNLTSYVLKISNPEAISDGERAEFGEMYMSYVNRGKPSEPAQEAAKIDTAEQIIDAEVIEDSGSGPIEI